MRYLKHFLQYDTIFESLILEKVLHFGEKMKDILKNMKHPYAKYMVNMNNCDNLEDVDNSYIEYSPKLGMVSWLPVNREIDFQTKQELPETEKWATKKRQDVSIGKVVTAVLKKLPSVSISESELEKFINEYKAIQNPGNFKLVKGDLIKHYYSQDNYDIKSEFQGCSLYNSCMRHSNCENYFSVYVKNPNVSLCILLTDEDKIQGRAIIWHNAIIDGNVGVYMDRIYAVSDSITDKFKSYAYSNGWYCKVKQGTESHTIIKDKEVIDDPEIKVILPDGDWEKWKKPYMDTLRYFSYDYDVKNVPVLFNYYIQNDTNWKQNWNEIDGDYNINRNYIDPLKEIRDFANSAGLDFNNLLLANPIKINLNPVIWKVNDKNILVINNLAYILIHMIRTESISNRMKLESFISDYNTSFLIKKIGSIELCEEYRSNIMMDILDNTDIYIDAMDNTSYIKHFIKNALGMQIMIKEINDNFINVRDFIMLSKPMTFKRILNDYFELDILDTSTKTEYYTKLKDDEKSRYYLTTIIESEYNSGEPSTVISVCDDYISRYILNDKNVIQMYNKYIADNRQLKMNFIDRYFNELVMGVNTTYLQLKINETPEKIREFAIKCIITKNLSFIAEIIIASDTTLGKETRISYIQEYLRTTTSYENVEVKSEISANKFCYFVENLFFIKKL